jgi:hypothetical protein
MFAVVALALLAIVGAGWRPSNAHQAAYTARDLGSVLTAANSIASAGADGATVYFTPSASGTLVTVYQGRPDLTSTPPTSDHYPVPVPVTLSDGTSSFGLVLARDGSASLLTGWSPWTQITAAPTSCTTVTLLVGRPGAKQSAIVSCDTLSLQ